MKTRCRFVPSVGRSIILMARQNRSFGQNHMYMRRLLLQSALAIIILLPSSCANNSSAATGAPASGNDGEGSLAFTIDGTRTVVKRPASSLYLNEVSHNAPNATVKIRVTIFPAGQLLDFVVADKGTTNVVNYKPSFGE